jgi:hypothetical protein
MAKLWKAADKINKPVVSGVYFISKENEGSLMKPFPVCSMMYLSMRYSTYIRYQIIK